MSASVVATGNAIFTNLLDERIPERRRIAAAVREAFESLPVGPWRVKLERSLLEDRVALDIVHPDGKTLTALTVRRCDSPAAIVAAIELVLRVAQHS